MSGPFRRGRPAHGTDRLQAAAWPQALRWAGFGGEALDHGKAEDIVPQWRLGPRHTAGDKVDGARSGCAGSGRNNDSGFAFPWLML